MTSRNFDGIKPYLYNQQCAWHFTANETSRISLSFSHFALESSNTGCAGDTFTIYDGENEKSPVLGIFCGVAIPPPVLSSGNNIFVTFKTDDRIENTGFKLQWNWVPGAIPRQPQLFQQQQQQQQQKHIVTFEPAFSTMSTTLEPMVMVPDNRMAQMKSIVQRTWPGAGLHQVEPTVGTHIHEPNTNFNHHRHLPLAASQPPSVPAGLHHNHLVPPVPQMGQQTSHSVPSGVRRLVDFDNILRQQQQTGNENSKNHIFRHPPPTEFIQARSARPAGGKEQSSSPILPFFVRQSAVVRQNPQHQDQEQHQEQLHKIQQQHQQQLQQLQQQNQFQRQQQQQIFEPS